MELHRSMKIIPGQRIIALAGGGGKTTSLYALSRECNAQGKRTVLMTTTHIGPPKGADVDLYKTSDFDGIRKTWEAGRIAAVGIVGEDGRMVSPDRETYDFVSREAEAIYIEADGSKCLPLKFPDKHEPAVPQNADRVIVLCGLSALDQPFDGFCHRAALAREKLGIKEELIDEKIIAKVLTAGYGEYHPVIILNQADSPGLVKRGEYIADLLKNEGIQDVSVISLHQILDGQKAWCEK